jgi:tripartite-type tricarboxylate transporter receptor subunit TctC
MLTRRTALAAPLLAPALAAAPRAARAQFNRPIRLIVPFAPGGTSDILARLMAPGLGQALGQNVVVENRTGANGNIAADLVAKSPPDGHTLLLTDTGSLATAPTLFRSLPFNVTRDLAPVTMLIFAPYLFATHPSVPARTAPELIAYAKANPDKINVAHSGVGSANQLTAIVIAKHFDIKWQYVPYRGGAAAVQAVAQNDCQVVLNGVTATAPFAVDGRLRGLAVSGDQRMAALPDAPSFKELNWPAVDSGTWQGIVTSAGTPAPVIATLSETFRKVMADPEIARRIADLGALPKAEGPDAFRAWLADAIERWGAVVKESGIVLD